MTATWWPEPNPGDIVWCLFEQVPGQPGPKPRPALVITVYDDDAPQYYVQVAYGTSQKTTSLHSGEFLISDANPAAYKLAGLSYPTKFDLKHSRKMPYNSDWFAVAPNGTASPILGTLHASLYKALGAAHAASKPAVTPAKKK